MIDYKKHIESNPEIMFGKPCIKGTRVPADLILRKLAASWTTADLLDAYPRITKEDIKACLLFDEDEEFKTAFLLQSKRFLGDNYTKFLEESMEKA